MTDKMANKIKMLASKRGKERVEEVSFEKAKLRLRAKKNNPSQTWKLDPNSGFKFEGGEIVPVEVKKESKPKKEDTK